MSRYTKTQVTQLSANEQAAIDNINKNFNDIQEAINDTVSRAGNTPTHMTHDLDMNGNRIINLPAPKTDTDPVRRQDVVGDIALVQSLVNATTNAAAQTLKAAADVQEIIQDQNVGLVADDLALDTNSKIRICGTNIDDITTVAGMKPDINTVVASKEDIEDVADNLYIVTQVANNKTNINTVASNISNVNTVAGISSDVTTVAGISSNVTSVAGNATNINTCASNMSAITGASAQAANAAASAISAANSAQLAQEAALSITSFDLFDHKWSDHLLNDQNWLRADTFSWQDGTVYSDAYNHLVDDATNGTSQTETISGHTITYTLADDGHKIVSDADASAVEGLYNDTGVAWYYILDLVNHKFKLPRENPAREVLGQSAPVVGNGMTLGLTDGTTNYGLGTQNQAIACFDSNSYGSNVGSTQSSNGSFLKTYGITTDPTKSGMIADLSETTGIYKGKQYLYFYVGQFSQTATEQTAGLNSELFNGKLDLDVGNATSSTKETIVGWGMPDRSSGVSKTFGTTYTAETDGWLYCFVFSNVDNHYTINGTDYTFQSGNGGGIYVCVGVTVPICKGDTYSATNAAAANSQMIFFPVKGE